MSAEPLPGQLPGKGWAVGKRLRRISSSRAVGALLHALTVIAFVVVITFALVRIVPGDPVVSIEGINSTPQARAAMRAQLHLNRPVLVQFELYVRSVATGDLGKSLIQQGRPVSEIIKSTLPVTLALIVTTVIISVLIGVPLAWVLARGEFPGRNLLRAAVVLPILLPPVVGGVGLLVALGRSGLVGRWLNDAFGIQLTFTTTGAVLATTFVSMPLVVLATEAGLRGLDRRYERAAAAMGGSPWYVFRRVTLPMVAPQLLAGAILTWARALGEFGATITFAGNLAGRTQTMPLAVYEARQVDPGGAIVLSLILVVISVAVLAALGGRLTGLR